MLLIAVDSSAFKEFVLNFPPRRIELLEMSQKSMDWIKSVLISHFEEIGVISKDSDTIRCCVVPLSGCGRASTMFQVELVAETCPVDEGGTKSILRRDMMVKIFPELEFFSQILNSEGQFHNEGKMYLDVLPLLLESVAEGGGDRQYLLEVSSLIPKCYHARFGKDQGIIALQNLSAEGYRHSEPSMDLKHLSMALKHLARFHALSYAMKKQNPTKFKADIVSPIKSVRGDMASNQVLSTLMETAARFPLQFLEQFYPQEYHKYSDKIRYLHQRFGKVCEIVSKTLSPDEPLSVLCHGDFTRNNILFKYDGDGEPCGVKFLDFQLASYSSPAIDVSSLFFLNTSPELRAEHWEDIFSAYHAELLAALSRYTHCPVESLISEYSLATLREDFGRHAIYGYFTAGIFLHVALGQHVEPNPDIVKISETKEGIASSVKEERNKASLEVKRRWAALVKEFIDLGYM